MNRETLKAWLYRKISSLILMRIEKIRSDSLILILNIKKN